MRAFYDENKAAIRKILFLVCFILLVFLFFRYLFAYVAPFVIGYLLSILLNPAAGFFERKCKIPRGVSALFLIVICILLISVLGTFVAGRIGREAESFSKNLPQYSEEAKRMLEGFSETVEDWFVNAPEGLRESFDKLMAGLGDSITTTLGSSVRAGSVGFVSRLPNAFMALILTIISTFFFIKDKRLIRSFMTEKAPEWLKGNLRMIRKELFGALGGYVKAQLIIMCVTTAIAVLGLSILQSPYALMMGLLISFIDAVPVFGSGFILWPWIVLELFAQRYPFAIGLGVIYGAIFLTRQFLEPKVLGQQIGLHPLLTLMSMYAGVRVFGVLGFLVGPVLVLVVKVVMRSEPPAKPQAEAVSGTEAEPQSEVE